MADRKAKPMDLGDDPSGSSSSKGTAGAQREERATPKPRARSGRPTKLERVEERLIETFDTLAMVQAGAAVVTADPRHELGAEVTSEWGPKLAHVWVKLARENARVEKMLIRMTEGSAWGEVTVTTFGFMLAQAQVYGGVDWMPFAISDVPAGDPTDPRETAGANGTGPVTPEPPVPGQGPMVGRQPPRSGVDDTKDPAQNLAEAQRRAVEERRRQRGS